MKHADVVIAGGGLVGLPLGLALGPGRAEDCCRQGRRPTGRCASWSPRFDGRVSALAYASVRMLTALGVWEELKAHAQPIHEILVTDGQAGKPASPFSLHFDAQEVGAQALGHIAENRHIRAGAAHEGGGTRRQT